MATHIAELNIGRFRYSADDARMAGFMQNLDRINAIAERSAGFVWRLKDESNNATAIRPFPDPDMAVNLSVWESAEALEAFVWNTVHARIYAGKPAWFEKLDEAHLVMWPIEAGHIPSLEEAKARLEHLRQHGNSDYAFGWSHLPHIRQWMAKKCG
ncbi:MAG: DUF3291 domain-containing protein [Hyphomicrobiales bacterium]|nr:DUF3291 domain-containing protein [Hyphomicrobiales bacterium]